MMFPLSHSPHSSSGGSGGDGSVEKCWPGKSFPHPIPNIIITDFDMTEEELAAKKLKARERVKQTDSSKGMLRYRIQNVEV